ncbi:unnamed protein product, partial [Choristocarpus tenellus]
RPCRLNFAERNRERKMREALVSELKLLNTTGHAKTVMKNLCKNQKGKMFTEEIDTVMIPDYLSKCPHPMWFRKVEANLGDADDSGRTYLHHSEFIRDIRLVISNALRYNSPDDPDNANDSYSVSYYSAAVYIEKEMEKMLAQTYTLNTLEEVRRQEILSMLDEEKRMKDKEARQRIME